MVKSKMNGIKDYRLYEVQGIWDIKRSLETTPAFPVGKDKGTLKESIYQAF